MSLWGEMRRRSAGKQERKEDKYLEDLKLDKNFPSDVWKNLYAGDFKPIHVNKEYIKDMDDFRWDGSRHSQVGDYYVIDYFSDL